MLSVKLCMERVTTFQEIIYVFKIRVLRMFFSSSEALYSSCLNVLQLFLLLLEILLL